MGIGDWLMVSGDARRRAAGTARKYRVLDKRGAPYWHFVFEHNPNIARLHEKFDDTIGFVDGHRPYIVDETKERRTFRAYRPEPAPIRLGPAAQALAKRAQGGVAFHPSIKAAASPNKAWGWERWLELVESAPEVRWVQIGEPGVPRVPGVEHVPTGHFWDACAVLAGAGAAVLHEGALHHAAAALGAPAVVIYGGYITPRVTGYEGQRALYDDSPEWPYGCGMRVPCAHCAAAMEAITPAAVLAALRGLRARAA